MDVLKWVCIVLVAAAALSMSSEDVKRISALEQRVSTLESEMGLLQSTPKD